MLPSLPKTKKLQPHVVQHLEKTMRPLIREGGFGTKAWEKVQKKIQQRPHSLFRCAAGHAEGPQAGCGLLPRCMQGAELPLGCSTRSVAATCAPFAARMVARRR